MPHTDMEESGRLLRTASTNVIGFWQLLQEPHVHKFSPVTQMQHRAYLTAGALNMADILLEHHEAVAYLRPRSPNWIVPFTDTARELKVLALALDGFGQEAFSERAFYFAVRFLGAINE